ncbi:hypothetical protein MES4922_140081 [Mesorhizobium ventifaucium]|uniref:Uncharacterized protein n=1 Tax=Mesorhizobium ventifaucium TaxID=666020 RepID=A0ABN8JD05_9HYPH|nr:hypothetical protein MES4922_140081 [Mesorhizobium ventifaucium]
MKSQGFPARGWGSFGATGRYAENTESKPTGDQLVSRFGLGAGLRCRTGGPTDSPLLI